MRLFQKVKDGGPDSPVDAYVLIEIKSLFSLMLLKFNPGKREAYHSHAFNAWTLWLKGFATEHMVDPDGQFHYAEYTAGSFKRTPRELVHRYFVKKYDGPAWALTFRGPWADTWKEYKVLPDEMDFAWEVTTLKSPGRQIIKREYV